MRSSRGIWYRSSAVLRALVIVGSVIAAVAVLVGLGLLVINRALIPRAIERAAVAVEAQSGLRLEVGSARYSLLGTLRLREVAALAPAVGDAPRDGISARLITIDQPLRVALRARRAELAFGPLHLPDPRATDAAAQAMRLAAELGADAAPLGAISLEVDELVARLPAGEFSADRLTLAHDPALSRVELKLARGESLQLDLAIEYKQRRAVLDLHADAGSLGVAGGDLAADLAAEVVVVIDEEQPGRVALAGTIAAENLRLRSELVSREPIDATDIEFEFKATLEPETAPPEITELPALSNLSRLTNSNEVIAAAQAERAPVAGSIVVDSGVLRLADLPIALSATLWGIYRTPQPTNQRPDPQPQLGAPEWIEAHAELETTAAQRIVAALPRAISGPIADVELAGAVGVVADLRLPLFAIAAMDWRAEVDLDGFHVSAIDPRIDPFRLTDSFLTTISDPEVEFERTVRIPEMERASVEWIMRHSQFTRAEVTIVEDERRATMTVRPPGSGAATVPIGGPGDGADPTYTYVRLGEMSEWVPDAVLTAEDGDFFYYRGINPVTLKAAIARNVSEGEIVTGASTISMQLVKMLFLDQIQTLARKLQEAFLVYLMEHHAGIPKDRILELYLNLAEFGPGIFGIAEAATHYFAKHPRELSAGEATWLASILPAPKTYHEWYYEGGGISEGWLERMAGYYELMLLRGRMNQAQYEAALAERPTFVYE